MRRRLAASLGLGLAGTAIAVAVVVIVGSTMGLLGSDDPAGSFASDATVDPQPVASEGTVAAPDADSAGDAATAGLGIEANEASDESAPDEGVAPGDPPVDQFGFTDPLSEPWSEPVPAPTTDPASEQSGEAPPDLGSDAPADPPPSTGSPTDPEPDPVDDAPSDPATDPPTAPPPEDPVAPDEPAQDRSQEVAECNQLPPNERAGCLAEMSG